MNCGGWRPNMSYGQLQLFPHHFCTNSLVLRWWISGEVPSCQISFVIYLPTIREDLDIYDGSVRRCEIHYHLMRCWLSLSCRLEDPDALEVKEYVAKQAELAAEVLKECHTRPTLKKKVTSLYNYPRYGCLYKRGKYFFYHYNSGLQAQTTMYIQVCPKNAFENLTSL